MTEFSDKNPTLELFAAAENAQLLESIPGHLRAGLRRYVEHRISPGSTLVALLSLDWFGFEYRAEIETSAVADIICDWLSKCAPPECWGSAQAVDAWLAGAPKRMTEHEAAATNMADTIDMKAGEDG